MPYVDGWIVDRGDKGKRLSFSQLAETMRAYEFDYLIELKPSWRTAAAGFFAGIPNRIGTSRRFYSFLYSNWVNVHRKGSGVHQTDLELEILSPMGIEAKGVNPDLTLTESCREKARKLLGNENSPYVVIHPGSSGSAPNWPLMQYRALAERILLETDLQVVITGIDTGVTMADRCLDLQGRTDLEALAGIVAGARLFISGSTGPLHLADALGTPCISFFVSFPGVEPERWGPRRNVRNVLKPPQGACKCRNPFACRCLEQITPETAFRKAKEVLMFDESRMSKTT
jgi:ADP-heptose:LPS heptosyltransferase